jgi:hypothetical protein
MLNRIFRFSDQIIEGFHNILFGAKYVNIYIKIRNLSLIYRRDQLYNVIQERDRPRLPLLQSFDWNLDVTLTTAYAQIYISFCLKLTVCF